MSLFAPIALLALHGSAVSIAQDAAPVSFVVPAPSAPPTLPPDELTIAIDVDHGDTIDGILKRLDQHDERLTRAARKVAPQATRVRPEQELQLTFVDGLPVPTQVRVQLDEDRTLVLDRTLQDWEADVEEVAYTATTAQIAMPVRSSFWRALVTAGLRAVDGARLANVVRQACDPDRDLLAGDRVVVVAELLRAPDHADKLGEIHAVRVIRGGEPTDLVHWRHADGSDGWFTARGEVARQPFLRAPIEEYELVSDFSYRRFHPVLHVARAHNGADLAAPPGTPIFTVADGVVTKAGWNGSHGRYVEIRHDDVWTTSYSHLSRVDVKPGQRIRQRDRVGAVGSTGLTTGPHLHYQMWKNGRFVNPMTVALPSQPTLEKADRDRFREAAAQWLALLPADGLEGIRLVERPAPAVESVAANDHGPWSAEQAPGWGVTRP